MRLSVVIESLNCIRPRKTIVRVWAADGGVSGQEPVLVNTNKLPLCY
jgi:hypothetical protein